MLKKLFNLLFSRLFIFGSLIFIQIFFFLALVIFLSQKASAIYVMLIVFSLFMVFGLYRKDINPAFKMVWALIILAFPIFGGLFFLLWGMRRMDPKMSKKQKHIHQATLEYCHQNYAILNKIKARDSQILRHAEYILNTGCAPVFERTKSIYLPDGETKFSRLLEELAKARKFIFLEYYTIRKGKMWSAILEILIEKAAAGLDVRVMYDDVGCLGDLPYKYKEELEAYSIKTEVFNPFQPRLYAFMNYRDHRKICVIDGNVGFSGGINISDEYINAISPYGHWKDTAVMMTGDAVWSLTLLFLQMWQLSSGDAPDYEKYRPTKTVYTSDGFIQPFGDGPLNKENVAENSYLNIISRAEKYVYIVTPYMVLDHEMITALKTASQSGVEVRILCPGIADHWFIQYVTQSYYGLLMSAGIKIFEYSPGFVHAKMIVSDDKVAQVGSVNMDFRSFYLLFECSTAFYYSTIVMDVKNDILNACSVSKLICFRDLTETPWHKKLVQSVLHIFAPLM
jgi:cardiolipin synthase